ncbi:PREDICTED: hexosaminidase D-like [Nicrophorus vespilloides]|uniref:beta-N-acetylhexosaminidase n=1 Tax=Nicrophorus vespilloides TaxID=110193 RepID=A0ABM1MX85_NICVS|nr:PREDICTED: hexosaminidase D-like [Nicrophorus vespilloides]
MDSLTLGSHRLVHLDLKGAPPKIAFFEKFLPFIKDIGATGILIEWEDTFPYTRELIQAGGLSNSAQACGAPYSIEEAKQLICIAEDCGLSVIPLVQTFGHMEFALKHDQWQGLREVESYPSSMCPSNAGTMPLIRSLIKQIISFHSNIQYIHIGADEVWHMGMCPSCIRRVQSNKYGKASLYLDHITEVAQYIKDNYPNLRIIIWDDMLRNIDLNILQEYYVGNLVEPMVWHYNNADSFQLGSGLWEKYSNIFTNVWGATAFKGATSSCQILPVNKYHVSNHESWLLEMGAHASKIGNFRGIVFTGWSRYDHYATLCELLPCAIPTLCLCMKTWLTGEYNHQVHSSVSKMLGYTDVDSILHMDTPIRPIPLAPQLSFPGWHIFLGFEWFANTKAKYKSIIDSDQMQTWFNQWQVLSNYTNPMQIESILPVLTSLLMEITSLEGYLKTNLEQYFYPHTIDELIGTLVAPIKQHLRQLKGECETQITNGCRVRGQKKLL